jgi:hypothetical protein
MSQKIAEFVDKDGREMIVTAFVDRARDNQGRRGIQLTLKDSPPPSDGLIKLSEAMQDQLVEIIHDRRTDGTPTATGDQAEPIQVQDSFLYEEDE